jgi:excisionase family DNA binding protein
MPPSDPPVQPAPILTVEKTLVSIAEPEPGTTAAVEPVPPPADQEVVELVADPAAARPGTAPPEADIEPEMSELIPVREAAKVAGKTDRTVRRWISDGLLPAETIDGQYMVKRSDVTALTTDTSDRTSADEPAEQGAAMVPISALSDVLQQMANAQSDAMALASRAGAAEARSEMEAARRAEVEADKQRVEAELAETRERLREAEAQVTAHVAIEQARAEALAQLPAPPEPAPEPGRRRRWGRGRS